MGLLSSEEPCISGSPSEEPLDWFLTNEMKNEVRAKINQQAGTKRAFAHANFYARMARLAG